MAFELTVYASGRGYPRLRKTRFRLVANLYRVGLLTHWVALKGFYLFQAPRLPPFLGFAWRDGVRVASRLRTTEPVQQDPATALVICPGRVIAAPSARKTLIHTPSPGRTRQTEPPEHYRRRDQLSGRAGFAVARKKDPGEAPENRLEQRYLRLGKGVPVQTPHSIG